MNCKSSAFFIVALCCQILFLAGCQPSPAEEKAAIAKPKTVIKITQTEVMFSDSTTQAFPASQPGDSLTTFFVLRHTEKDTARENPDLTLHGADRAKRLAKIFEESGVTHVFTTPYKRTIQTAQPVATITRAPMISREFDKIEEAAAFYLQTARGGKAFISGHSNTNPQLLNFFAGKEVLPQIPDEEYDNLYVIFVPKMGQATWWTFKY